jgi:hypothetical protein
MIVDRSRKLPGFQRHALGTAQILVRAAIALQIRRFQSNSRAKQRAIAAVLAVIGLLAATLGLVLKARASCARSHLRKPTLSKPGVPGRFAGSSYAGSARDGRMILQARRR